jgi:hypothetical protein
MRYLEALSYAIELAQENLKTAVAPDEFDAGLVHALQMLENDLIEFLGDDMTAEDFKRLFDKEFQGVEMKCEFCRKNAAVANGNICKECSSNVPQ